MTFFVLRNKRYMIVDHFNRNIDAVAKKYLDTIGLPGTDIVRHSHDDKRFRDDLIYIMSLKPYDQQVEHRFNTTCKNIVAANAALQDLLE